MDSDRSLVKRFCAGDDEAFYSLVGRYAHMVLATCRRIVRDHHMAEDAAQMTFETLARKAHTIRSRRCLAAWLHRVAYRQALRQRQLAQRRRESFDFDVDWGATAEECWRDIQRRYELELLDQELQRLPLKYRRPLVLHYLLGCSQKETADTLGLRESTVKGRLQRGRSQLRRRLVGRGVRCSLLLALLQRDALSAQLSTPAHAPFLAKWSRPFPDGSALGIGPDSAFSHFSRSLTMRLSTLTVSSILVTGLLGGLGLSLCFGTTGAPQLPIPVQSPSPILAAQQAVPNPGFREVSLQLAQAAGATTSPASTTLLKYSDQKPDGRKSIAGTGEMIRFELPSAEQRVRAIKIHGSRYGYPRPPAEDFVLRFLNEDMSEVLHEQKAPYSLFKRGNAEWVTVRFNQPLKVSKVFWVAVNFNAERTKGVYVSYDSSTEGEFSRVGWPPQRPAEEPNFEGDWMIEAVLTRESPARSAEG